jgi:uncharacterized membrane protein
MLIKERDASRAELDQAYGRIEYWKQEATKQKRDALQVTNVVTYIATLSIVVLSIFKFITSVITSSSGNGTVWSMVWLTTIFATLLILRMLVSKAWL